MTAKINSTTATTTVAQDGTITPSVNGQELTLSAGDVTAVTTALLAGRKAAYAAERTAREAAKAEAKREREAKRAQREKESKARKAEQLKKLKARVAKLEKAA